MASPCHAFETPLIFPTSRARYFVIIGPRFLVSSCLITHGDARLIHQNTPITPMGNGTVPSRSCIRSRTIMPCRQPCPPAIPVQPKMIKIIISFPSFNAKFFHFFTPFKFFYLFHAFYLYAIITPFASAALSLLSRHRSRRHVRHYGRLYAMRPKCAPRLCTTPARFKRLYRSCRSNGSAGPAPACQFSTISLRSSHIGSITTATYGSDDYLHRLGFLSREPRVEWPER